MSHFSISQPTFQGPIELLLNMIEQRKLSISDISLATVADEYVSYVRGNQTYPLGEVTQFVWVASTLVLIKAKSLLPELDLTSEESQDVLLLQERLRKLSLVREFGNLVEKNWGVHPLFASPSRFSHIEAFTPGKNVTLLEFQSAVDRICSKPIEETDDTKFTEVAVPSVIRIEDIMSRITNVLSSGTRGSYKSLTEGVTEKRSLIVTFLALLEMARQLELTVQQDEVFADITFGNYVKEVEIASE